MPAAQPAKAGDSKTPVKIEPGVYENRTRDRWVLECPGRPEGDIIFGDTADRNVEGERDPVYRRDPVVRLDAETIERLPEHSKRYLAALMRKGFIERKGAIA